MFKKKKKKKKKKIRWQGQPSGFLGLFPFGRSKGPEEAIRTGRPCLFFNGVSRGVWFCWQKPRESKEHLRADCCVLCCVGFLAFWGIHIILTYSEVDLHNCTVCFTYSPYVPVCMYVYIYIYTLYIYIYIIYIYALYIYGICVKQIQKTHPS